MLHCFPSEMHHDIFQKVPTEKSHYKVCAREKLILFSHEEFKNVTFQVSFPTRILAYLKQKKERKYWVRKIWIWYWAKQKKRNLIFFFFCASKPICCQQEFSIILLAQLLTEICVHVQMPMHFSNSDKGKPVLIIGKECKELLLMWACECIGHSARRQTFCAPDSVPRQNVVVVKLLSAESCLLPTKVCSRSGS